MLSFHLSVFCLLFIVGLAVADDMDKPIAEALERAKESCKEEVGYTDKDFDIKPRQTPANLCALLCVFKKLAIVNQEGNAQALSGMPPSVDECMKKVEKKADCSHSKEILACIRHFFPKP